MPILRDELAEIIHSRMVELHLNPYDVQRKSDGKISHTTVRNIVDRKVREIRDETLETLIKALKIPRQTVLALLKGEYLDNPENEVVMDSEARFFVSDLSLLNPEDREFLNQAIRMLRHEIQRRIESYTVKVTERTRGVGLMGVQKSEEKVFDLEEIYQKVRSRGIEVDYNTVKDVIMGKAPDVDEETKMVILVAAGIISDSHIKEGTNGS